MKRHLLFFFDLLKISMKASMGKRAAFLLESALMIANNLIFFSIWWIFFKQFNDVAGWNLNDMFVLMITGFGGYGLMQICFGGVRDLAKMILEGALDPLMIRPKNLLVHVLALRSYSKGWGHLLTAVCLFFLAGFSSFKLAFLIIFSILSSCFVFTSMNIIANSLPFWFGSIDSVSKKYCDSLFLFALYPTNIYSGLLQLAMFTLIPAGVIGYLPVELVRSFSWPSLVLLAASSFVFFALAAAVFYKGLKKYESGNRFGPHV